jgi:hypothetical protein
LGIRRKKGRATQGAWFDLPALDMVDLLVAVVQVAVGGVVDNRFGVYYHV